MPAHGPVYLIDGSGYIFRAFYAIRHLSTQQGLPTNAIYGFTQMLLSFLKTTQPQYAAVVFDSKEPSFRHELFPAYKANRKEPPEELVPQFAYFPQVVAGLNLPQFRLPGFEADDIIGTLATRLAAQGHDVVIITGDKDFMQLVGDRITLWDTMKERRIDRAGVREKFGVEPEQVIDVMGLSGDSVDNVPGVPGVGPKTATKLIQDWGSMENALAHASEIKGKLGENLQAHAEAARLSKRLVTIHTEVPVPDGIETLQIGVPVSDQLRALFAELEFTKLQQELTPQARLAAAGYRLVTDSEALQALVHAIQRAGRCALDTETTSLNTRQADLVGMAIATAPGEAWYLPLAHVAPETAPQLPLATVVAALAPLCADPQIGKFMQNAKFDLPMLARHGLPITGLQGDTMLMAYVVNPAGGHGLDALAQRYLQHSMIAFDQVMGTGKSALPSFAQVPLDQALAYAAEDADVTLQLVDHLQSELAAAGLLPVYREIEMPLIEILLAMETAGVRVDAAQLAGLQGECAQQLQQLEQQIYAAAGTEFKIQSPKQLGEILFEKLQLPGGKRTKTGFSTSADVLEALAAQHPIVALVLEYRAVSKLQSTYVEALPKLIDPLTGRVHTDFHQTGAATGRLSSSDPNLQNIPIRSALGRRIRAAFVPQAGWRMLAADYSQIELRVLAHISGEPKLIAAFTEDRDVHAQTAADIFGVPLDQVRDEQRAVGKTVNFAVLYGQTAYGLSRQLQIAPDAARRYIEQYWTQYPHVAAYREAVLAQCRAQGFVTTLYGRRRFFPEITNSNVGIRMNAERMAFNTVFQGTAADIMKLAMIAVARALAMSPCAARMLIQVHDELVFELPPAELDAVADLARTAMSGVMSPAGAFAVPLRVDIHSGTNWAEC